MNKNKSILIDLLDTESAWTVETLETESQKTVSKYTVRHPKTRGVSLSEVLLSNGPIDDATKCALFLSPASSDVTIINSGQLKKLSQSQLEGQFKKLYVDASERIYLKMDNLPAGESSTQDQPVFIYSCLAAEPNQARQLAEKCGFENPSVYLSAQVHLAALRKHPAHKSERTAVLDLSEQHSQIWLYGPKGLLAFRQCKFGLELLFEEIQRQLELKFVGSAAKLFYDGAYDFSGQSDSLVQPLGNALKAVFKDLSMVAGGAPTRILPMKILPQAKWVEAALADSLLLPLVNLNELNQSLQFDESAASLEESISGNGILLADQEPGLLDISQIQPGLEALFANLLPAVQPMPDKQSEPVVQVVADAPKPEAAAKPKPEVAAKPKPEAVTAAVAKKVVPAAKKPAKPASIAAPKVAAQVPPPVAQPAPAITPAPEAQTKPAFGLYAGIAAAVVVAAIVLFVVLRKPAQEPEMNVASTAPSTVVEESVSERNDSSPAQESVSETVQQSVAAEVSSEVEAVIAVAEVDNEPVAVAEPEEQPEEAAVEEEPITTGGVYITSTPRGAEILIEGIAVGRTPLEIVDYEQGLYNASLVLDGFEPLEFSFEVVAGEIQQPETIGMEPEWTLVERLRRTGQPIVGTLAITSEPEGIAFRVTPADSESHSEVVHTGVTPAVLDSLEYGNYNISYEREEWEPVTVHAGFTETSLEAEAHWAYEEAEVLIKSEPEGVQVFRNGALLGVTPLKLRGLPPGVFSCSLEKESYVKEDLTTELSAGESTEINIQLVDLSKVFKINELDKLPELVHSIEPKARAWATEDVSVVIACILDDTGIPTELEIHSSTNERFNRYALEAVKEWRFEPARYKTHPVKVNMRIPIVFSSSM